MKSRMLFHLLLFMINCCYSSCLPQVNDCKWKGYDLVKKEKKPYYSEVIHITYDHLWAGSYIASSVEGDSHNLILTPASGYYYECHNDKGPCGWGKGELIYAKSKIILLGNNNAFPAPTAFSELLLIQWGPRRYLIPDRYIWLFVTNIKSGYEPRMTPNGLWLLREGDWQRITSGYPVLPKKYRYLLSE